jgi:group I intron endonuclease
MDFYKPEYNIAKIAGSTLGVKPSELTKKKISESLKNFHKKNRLLGINKLILKTHTLETKELMSKSHSGEKNSIFGKKHSKKILDLMRKIKTGKILSSKTRKAITIAHGISIYIYKFVACAACAACADNTSNDKNKFLLINKFDSIREAGRNLGISHSTITKYLKSGNLFKNTYKFSKFILKN